MQPIPVMVNGIPGKMALAVAEHVLSDEGFALIPWALTGPEIASSGHRIGQTAVKLIHPDDRDEALGPIIDTEGPFISVDYTHPAAVNSNAAFYCSRGLPFVMGTTGGDREQLAASIRDSQVAAVVAPNMAKQIVGFQAMMAYAAETFPKLFNGYRLAIRESHQQGKADTSGTAKAMVGYFNRLGIPFSPDDIIRERDPERQQVALGVPAEHLGGHGWHAYTLHSADGSVRFEFTHNVNGRDIYARGTLDAVAFLEAKVREGLRGRMFTMIDVLKGG